MVIFMRKRQLCGQLQSVHSSTTAAPDELLIDRKRLVETLFSVQIYVLVSHFASHSSLLHVDRTIRLLGEMPICRQQLCSGSSVERIPYKRDRLGHLVDQP